MARKRANNQLRRRARRDVRSAYGPQLNELDRQKREARDLYEEGISETGDIYERTNNMLGDLMPNWKDATANISSDYMGNLGQLSGLLGLSAPDSEEDFLSQGLLGSIGAGGLGEMANSQQRNLSYMQSSKRQALYDRNTTEKNYLESFQDIVREIGNTRFDVRQDMSTQVMARFDQLRQQRFENRLAKKEYELRKTIAEKQESRADKESRTQRRAQNYATERLSDAKTKNELRKLINNLTNRKSDVKEDIAELKDKYPGLIQRNGKWGYMSTAGPNGQESFIEVPEMKTLVRKKRNIKGNLQDAKRKRRNA